MDDQPRIADASLMRLLLRALHARVPGLRDPMDFRAADLRERMAAHVSRHTLSRTPIGSDR